MEKRTVGEKHTIAVIIPVYNCERFLPDCLESVITQTLCDIEIICVDDASTDGSLAILKSYQKRDDRIRILQNEKNSKQAATRNRGMEASNSEYFYFLDADDMLADADALRQMLQTARREQLDILIFERKILFENDELRERFRKFEDVMLKNAKAGQVMSGPETFVLITSRDYVPCQPGRFLYSCDFLNREGIRFQEESAPHEDYLFWGADRTAIAGSTCQG